MRPIQMVDLSSQYLRIKNELDIKISEVLNKAVFIGGTDVSAFEDNLSTYSNSKYCISCANGTDAIQIALQTLNLPKEAEIIVPTFNYVAAVEAIAFLGYKPVFVDSEELSFNLNPQKFEAHINKNTKAIIVVHLFGQSCEMEQIMAVAKKYDIHVIEDNAQTLGAMYHFANGDALKTGTMGDIATTSFFPSKNLGCMGDGGAIFTQNDDLAKKIRMIANHGQKQKYHHEIVGVNSRLDTLQAAILNVKLKHLDSYIAKRQQSANFYDNALANVRDIIIPYRSPRSSHTFHQYTIKVKGGKRNELKTYLHGKGIPTMVYYPMPVHLQKAYQYLNYKQRDFPVAESLCHEVLSLPMHTELDKEQLSYIAENILNFFK